MIRLELTEEQAAQLEEAKPAGKAAFVVGYAQRHEWPHPERWSLVLIFCGYSQAVKAGQAVGLLDRQRRLKPAKKSRPRAKRRQAEKPLGKQPAKKRVRKPGSKKPHAGGNFSRPFP